LKEFDSRAASKVEDSKSKRKDDGWGERGGYMKAKADKLKDQFLSTTTKFLKKSDIFAGVSIWVNGYTNPSYDELKLLVRENGGEFQHFFSKTHVTHVIASNICESKIKNLKRNDKVVHPNWIVESVKANCLLAIDKFLLHSVAKRDGSAITFAAKKPRTTHTASSFINTSNPTVTVSPREQLDGNISNNISFELPNMIQKSPSKLLSSESPSKVLPSEMLQSRNKLISESSFSTESPNNSSIPSLTSHQTNNSATGSSNRKAGDPNFISEFYAHSRLHHLAMWKSELKKFATSIQSKRKDHLKTNNKNHIIMHIDLDSFFVSVSYKMDPSLKGKPVAVCHATGKGKNNDKSGESWSEIASCSYQARSKGVKNGMLIFRAKELCPELVCVPYNFDEYRNVSQQFYEIISSYTSNIEAVSCDEALVDIMQLVNQEETVLQIAEKIRSEIYDRTGCIASCGISSSILVARLATKQAKPNGVCYITDDMIKSFIRDKKVEDLPGIGRVQHKKLESLNIATCADLQTFSLALLQKEFGKKNGEHLYNHCRGKDERQLEYEHERKSVSAEINYGMRFTQDTEVHKFIHELSEEVEKRLKEIERYASKITLKLMVRSKDASVETAKFMGHGKCESLSKSQLLPTPTNDASSLSKNCLSLLRPLKIPPADIRGMGIQMTNLSDGSTGRSATIFDFAKPASRETSESPPQTTITNVASTVSKNNQVSNPFIKFQATKSSNTRTSKVTSHFVADIIGDKSSPSMVDVPSLPTWESIVNLEDGTEASVAVANTFENNRNNWDPAVIKELPQEIQDELLNQLPPTHIRSRDNQNQVHNSSNKASPSKINSPMKGKNPHKGKIPVKTYKVSPGKKSGRGRPKKILDTNKYVDIRNISKPKTVNRTENILSSSTVDMETLKELPEELQLEILAQLKNSSYTTRKNINASSQIVGKTSKQKPYINNKAAMTTSSVKDIVNISKSTDTFHDDKIDNISTSQGSNASNDSDSCRITEVKIVVQDISKTLKVRETQENKSKTHNDQLLLCPSQLDSSFLNALPDNVRTELLLDMKKCKQEKEKKSDDAIRENSFKGSENSNKASENSNQARENLVEEQVILNDTNTETYTNYAQDVSEMNSDFNEAPSSLHTQESTDEVKTKSCNENVSVENKPELYVVPSVNVLNTSCLMSPSQLDQSFLNALPPDIRDDVLKDAETVKRQKLNKNNLLQPSASKTSHFVEPESLIIYPKKTTSKTLPFDLQNVTPKNKLRLGGKPGPSSSVIPTDFLSPSQLDFSVLAALPDNIRDEVQSNANNVKRKRLRANELKRTEEEDKTVIEEKTPVLKKRLIQVLPRFHGISEVKDVKILFRQWVTQSPEPFIEDVEEVLTYFKHLLSSHNMENLFIYIKFLRRLCGQTDAWRTAFNIISREVQALMKSKYNGTLPINLFMNT